MKKLNIFIFSVLALFCLCANAQTTDYDLNDDNATDVADLEILLDVVKNGCHHDCVDLGLPSGLLWATTNIGSETPEGRGYFFAWGETTPQSDNEYSWKSYKWCKGTYNTLTKYSYYSDYGYEGFTDGKVVLDIEDDAARAIWRNDWRMPTEAEFQELFDKTTAEWTTVNGVLGYKLTSQSNGNSIFLPVTGGIWDGMSMGEETHGFYRTSVLEEITDYKKPLSSRVFGFYYKTIDMTYQSRYCGMCIRPVR
jgi:hypothetical protein